MTNSVEDFLLFLSNSPTSWHCVKEVEERLRENGFLPLKECTPWDLQKGGKYFVTRGGSIGAFCLPQVSPQEIMLVAAHTDSPGLKIKPHPVIEKGGMSLLEVEVYGSPILHSWFNRDLAIAGRYFTKDERGDVKENLLFAKETAYTIPELAIHLQREVNEKGPLVNKQENLMPLFSCKSEETFLNIKDVLSFDLFLVPTEPPRLSGMGKEWIASYRLDNLASVHAATCAITSYKDSPLLPMVFFFDHEEIGSRSWEGASSSFLSDALLRIKKFYKLSEEDFLILKNKSLCLSLDMAHALNPMHIAKHDPNHQPILGKGLVLKENADLKYASSAHSAAKAMQIAAKQNLSLQLFSCRSDMPCGSTIGPFITSSTGIQTVDLGCPQLSMHSIRELMAVSDYEDSIKFLMQAFSKV